MYEAIPGKINLQIVSLDDYAVVLSPSRAGSSHSSSWRIFSSARLGSARDLFHFSSKLKIGQKRAEFQFSVEIFFD